MISPKKILMVFAHPDDEVIFGWPVFQDKSIDKTLLICSSDLNNPERQWCKHRKYTLQSICNRYGIKLICFDYSSEFYREETRNEGLSKIREQIASKIAEHSYDYIFTHNPIGEYGHLDHKFVFETVLFNSRYPILYTDICLKTNWPSTEHMPHRLKNLYYKNKYKNCVLDDKIYEDCQGEYEKSGVWTWSLPAVKACSLYILK